MTICAFASFFMQARNPHTVSKARLVKVAAFAAGLGLGTLSCTVHAAPASGGDTVRGLYDALLNTMKNGRTLAKAGVSRNSTRLFAAASTSPRWRGCRSAGLGPV